MGDRRKAGYWEEMMGITTAISWTDRTWNPWRGCDKLSPGCVNCYMYRDMNRFKDRFDPTTVTRAAHSTFFAPRTGAWSKPARVFTCSWSDFFHEAADEWRGNAWDVIRHTPHLTYQILTKRSHRIKECLPFDWDDGYPNVWLGVTGENQACYDERMGNLLEIPAALRFVSCEPLLEDIDLRLAIDNEVRSALGWVIVGGESGPGFRVMDPIWAMRIQMQCAENGIPFFFKQHSGARPGKFTELYGKEYKQVPEVK